MHHAHRVVFFFCQINVSSILSHAEKLCRMCNSSVLLFNDSDIVIYSLVSYVIMFITCNYNYCIYKILCKMQILIITVNKGHSIHGDL